MWWDKMRVAPCLARDSCKFVGDDRICAFDCKDYHALHKLIEYSYMPKEFHYDTKIEATNANMQALKEVSDFISNLEYHVREGHGLYFYYENKGTGKTMLACRILKKYFELIAGDYDFERSRGVYISTVDFFEELRDNMDNPSKEMRIKLQRIKNADIVIWDDIGAERPSEWVNERLYQYINHRWSNNLTQLFTSNCDIDKLQSQIKDDRIVDRIYGQCKPIKVAGQSRRRQNPWWSTK